MKVHAARQKTSPWISSKYVSKCRTNVSHLFHSWSQNILFYNHSGNFQQDPHTYRHFDKDQVSTRHCLNYKFAQVLAYKNAQKDGAGYQELVYTTQVNTTFRARWLASSEVISQVLFTSEQPKKNKMAFVAIF